MIRKSNKNWYLAGVCGGIAEATDTNPIAWRLLFIFAPYSLWVYIALWILLKENNETKPEADI